jgi:hypothetical protein
LFGNQSSGSWYPGFGWYPRSEGVVEESSGKRLSCIVLECTIVIIAINPIDNPIPRLRSLST